METKEKIAYILGTIIILYGSFVGRDFSKSSDVLEGVIMVAFFIGVFIVFYYINKRGIGDWAIRRHSPYS